MRHFGKFPPGIEYENLLDIQKEFIMLLVATAPTANDLGHIIRYQTDKQKIKDTDYSNEIATPEYVIEMSAKYKGLSVVQYKKELVEDIRAEKIKELNTKYGLEEPAEKDDPALSARAQTLEKYNAIANDLEENKKLEKMKNVHQFFEGPK